MATNKEKMTTCERVDNAAEQVIANADVNADKIIECFQQGLSKLAPKKFSHINMWASESNREEHGILLTHYTMDERGDDICDISGCSGEGRVTDCCLDSQCASYSESTHTIVALTSPASNTIAGVGQLGHVVQLSSSPLIPNLHHHQSSGTQ